MIIIMLIKKKKPIIYIIRIEGSFHFFSPKDDLCQIWLKLVLAVLENNIFKFCQCIFAISWLSPLGKGLGPSFDQTWILVNQECIVPSLVEIGPVVLEEKNFLIKTMFFRYFLIISPWKRTRPLIWINLNLKHPRMHCGKFR